MHLIDADILLEQMKHRKDYVGCLFDPVCLIKDAPIIEIIHCKDCKWRGKVMKDGSIEWPDKELFKCPGQVDDHYYDWIPDDDFYCANGERG